jgi:hypothetical protein
MKPTIREAHMLCVELLYGILPATKEKKEVHLGISITRVLTVQFIPSCLAYTCQWPVGAIFGRAC